MEEEFFALEDILQTLGVMRVPDVIHKHCQPFCSLLQRKMKCLKVMVVKNNANLIFFDQHAFDVNLKRILMVSEDIIQDTRMTADMKDMLSPSVSAYLGMPLLLDGGKWGTLLVFYSSPHFFTPKEISLIDEVKVMISERYVLQRQRIVDDTVANLLITSVLMSGIKLYLTIATTCLKKMDEEFEKIRKSPSMSRGWGEMATLCNRLEKTYNQLEIAIERALSLAKNYTMTDRKSYYMSCFQSQATGFMKSMNEVLDNLSRIMPEHHLMWSYRLESEDHQHQLAHCSHRTFSSHLLFFLEGLVDRWSTSCSSAHISFTFQPKGKVITYHPPTSRGKRKHADIFTEEGGEDNAGNETQKRRHDHMMKITSNILLKQMIVSNPYQSALYHHLESTFDDSDSVDSSSGGEDIKQKVDAKEEGMRTGEQVCSTPRMPRVTNLSIQTSPSQPSRRWITPTPSTNAIVGGGSVNDLWGSSNQPLHPRIRALSMMGHNNSHAKPCASNKKSNEGKIQYGYLRVFFQPLDLIYIQEDHHSPSNGGGTSSNLSNRRLRTLQQTDSAVNIGRPPLSASGQRKANASRSPSSVTPQSASGGEVKQPKSPSMRQRKRVAPSPAPSPAPTPAVTSSSASSGARTFFADDADILAAAEEAEHGSSSSSSFYVTLPTTLSTQPLGGPSRQRVERAVLEMDQPAMNGFEDVVISPYRRSLELLHVLDDFLQDIDPQAHATLVPPRQQQIATASCLAEEDAMAFMISLPCFFILDERQCEDTKKEASEPMEGGGDDSNGGRVTMAATPSTNKPASILVTNSSIKACSFSGKSGLGGGAQSASSDVTECDAYSTTPSIDRSKTVSVDGTTPSSEKRLRFVSMPEGSSSKKRQQQKLIGQEEGEDMEGPLYSMAMIARDDVIATTPRRRTSSSTETVISNGDSPRSRSGSISLRGSFSESLYKALSTVGKAVANVFSTSRPTTATSAAPAPSASSVTPSNGIAPFSIHDLYPSAGSSKSCASNYSHGSNASGGSSHSGSSYGSKKTKKSKVLPESLPLVKEEVTQRDSVLLQTSSMG